MNYSDLPPWPDVSRWVLTVTKTISSSRIPVSASCQSENPRTFLVTTKASGIEDFIRVSTSSILLVYRHFGIEIKVISLKAKRMYNKRELKRLFHNFSTGSLDSKIVRKWIYVYVCHMKTAVLTLSRKDFSVYLIWCSITSYHNGLQLL